MEIDSTSIDTPGKLNPPIDPYAMEGVPKNTSPLEGDDCKDAGGRATQGAVAEVARSAGEGSAKPCSSGAPSPQPSPIKGEGVKSSVLNKRYSRDEILEMAGEQQEAALT